MGAAGNLHVELRTGSEPKFHFAGPVTSSRCDYELDRIYDDLEDACRQFAKLPGSLHIVVLESLFDSWTPTRSAGMVEIINTESWATNLAGVIVIERQVNEFPDCVVTPIPGKQWESLEPLMNGLRVCSNGHFHADLGTFPVPECGHFWLSEPLFAGFEQAT